MEWSDLARLRDGLEARMLLGRLESEGIPCRLEDEHTINTDWLLSNALGGVKLQVPKAQLETALEILTQAQEQGAKQEGMVARCPHCGGEELECISAKRRWSIGFLFSVVILLGLPLFRSNHRRRCKSCRYEWA